MLSYSALFFLFINYQIRLITIYFKYRVQKNKTKEKRNTVRTLRVNDVFSLIASTARVVDENKKGNLKKDYLNSHLVEQVRKSTKFLVEDLKRINQF